MRQMCFSQMKPNKIWLGGEITSTCNADDESHRVPDLVNDSDASLTV